MPAYCVPPAADLQDVTTTPASAYFVHHPDVPSVSTPTVIFLPGGAGSRDIGQIIWQRYLQAGDKAGAYRLVVPYSVAGDFTTEGDRTFQIVDEVLACYGGDPKKVHLAGTSNGGVAAFALMVKNPAPFATLLGAPGVFGAAVTDGELTQVLGARPVYNGVGALDTNWMPGVKATHARLKRLGVDSSYTEFAGQQHIVDSTFDPSVFFAFWSAH